MNIDIKDSYCIYMKGVLQLKLIHDIEDNTFTMKDNSYFFQNIYNCD